MTSSSYSSGREGICVCAVQRKERRQGWRKKVNGVCGQKRYIRRKKVGKGQRGKGKRGCGNKREERDRREGKGRWGRSRKGDPILVPTPSTLLPISSHKCHA